jgi:hypothetical protein
VLIPTPDLRVSIHDNGIVIFHPTNGEFFVSNRLGAEIWRRLNFNTTLHEISARVSEQYNVPAAVALADTMAFAGDLMSRRLVKSAPVPKPPRRKALLMVQALVELLRYDISMALFGYGAIERGLDRVETRPAPCLDKTKAQEGAISAVALASCLYWKPVRCLQRSVVLTRLLRGHGTPAELVIGYRAHPFFSHAWVEVDGRTINDFQGYFKQLAILYRA